MQRVGDAKASFHFKANLSKNGKNSGPGFSAGANPMANMFAGLRAPSKPPTSGNSLSVP